MEGEGVYSPTVPSHGHSALLSLRRPPTQTASSAPYDRRSSGCEAPWRNSARRTRS